MEELKIQEAETEQPKNENGQNSLFPLPPVEEEKKRRADIYVEMVLIFILGILVGVAVKTEAIKRITMGFDDYKMRISSQDYDINALQKELIQKGAENQAENQEQADQPPTN